MIRKLVLLVTLVLALSCVSSPPPAVPELDLKLAGGRIVDGTGAPWFRADLGVRGDTIVAIGDLSAVTASKTIELAGSMVAPGFIDLLGQSQSSVLVDPSLEGKVRQGVTTEVTGEGWSPGPVSEEAAAERRDAGQPAWTTLADYFQVLESQGSATNFAFFVGATNARSMVLGSIDRDPTEEELRQMEEIVDQAMLEGAIGLSTSLIYVPATFAETEELVRLARVASRRGGVYFSHIRNEEDLIVPALDEAFRIGREADIPVNVWHLKTSGPANHGRMPEILAKIEQARSEGIDVAANMYPYPASSTGLTVLVPSWALEGGYAAFLERLKDPSLRARIGEQMREKLPRRVSGPEGVLVTRIGTDEMEAYEKKTLAEIARSMDVDWVEAALRLYEANLSSPGAVYFSMSERDVQAALRHPWVAIGADSGAVPESRRGAGAHPRAYGTFPRILGHYARELGLFPVEEAVRKMTSLAAARAQLRDHGILRPGMKADVVVFDPATVRDLATFEDPHRYSVGIEHVIVNGVPVLEDGAMTGRLPGRVLRGPAWRP
ncbi:MAG TPA: D-aminoacylase [Thermoanaerobaculia bacterium]|nr:D-aminoacylase [Thermoanaerobaculia bacterium]